MGIVKRTKNRFYRLIGRDSCRTKECLDGMDTFTVIHPGNDMYGKIIFCIDEASTQYSGFFSVLNNIVSGLCLCDRYGFIPLIGFHHSELYCKTGSETDFFDSYFDRTVLPAVSASDAFNLIRSKPEHLSLLGTNRIYDQDNPLIKEFSSVIKNYLRYNPATEDYLNNNVAGTIRAHKTLGVHVRGTDYKKGYRGHARIVLPQEYLEHTVLTMKSGLYDRVFLATDEEDTVELFKREFGSNLIVNEVFRAKGETSIGIHCLNDDRLDHKHLLGLEVLSDMNCLAQCDGLIAGISGVSFHAMLNKVAMGTKYDTFEIIDKGLVDKGEISYRDIERIVKTG